ncbi:uncharacterized protein EAE98_007302 [Botrytis deweyae]|uniref:Copper transporter n=1 Tax=Botrytis deweyae TaxID=2478750 RepID=A0ABQ7IH88_9HELO|nr:uncharacterized protein EAE98_007302 [Botrytis deweyae]KAF7924251.1 hypothetical protein EAE98_007302 [Botrytis deweyae]
MNWEMMFASIIILLAVDFDVAVAVVIYYGLRMNDTKLKFNEDGGGFFFKRSNSDRGTLNDSPEHPPTEPPCALLPR